MEFSKQMILDNKENLAGTAVVLLLLALAAPFVLDALLLQNGNHDFNASAEVVAYDEEPNKTLGVNADPSMDYGQVPVNSTVTKYVNLSSNGSTAIHIGSRGNISDKLHYDRYDVFTGNKTARIGFVSSKEGNFTGQVSINTYTPENSFGERWLRLREPLSSYY